jgi:hypothetical protein
VSQWDADFVDVGRELLLRAHSRRRCSSCRAPRVAPIIERGVANAVTPEKQEAVRAEHGWVVET